MNSRCYLIGMRATGKTSIGRLLARRLGWPFVDTDEEIERRTGQTIRDLFATRGETVFRELETDVLRSLSRRSPAVIATGGGIVLDPANRRLLRDTGQVIWLHAPPTVLWQRMQADPNTATRRPNLTIGGLAEIESLLAERTPLYQAVADYEFDTSRLPPEVIAEEIFSKCPTFC